MERVRPPSTRQRDAGDVARPRRAEERRRGGDLLGRAEPGRPAPRRGRRPRPPRASRKLQMRSVAMRPGRIVLKVIPSAASWRASVLKPASRPARCEFESIRWGSARATADDATLRIRPKPRSRMPGTTRLDQRHRREHELAVGALPLLAGEPERVGRRRARRCWSRGSRRARAPPRPRRPARARRRGRRCRARSRGADLGGRGVDALARARADRHARTLVGQRARDAEADALGGAGHERDLALDPRSMRRAI